MRLRITAEAFADLADVSDFGAERWGEDVARNYTDRLVARLNSLQAYPELGPIDDEQTSFRRLNAGRHIAFYQIGFEEVIIIRVLHAAQDPSRHLP